MSTIAKYQLAAATERLGPVARRIVRTILIAALVAGLLVLLSEI
jgi:hypothetical protein